MSKKTFAIIIVLILLAFGIAGWYFFFRTAQTPDVTIPDTPSSDLFPFGQGGTGGKVPPSTTGGPGSAGTTTIDLSLSEDDVTTARLRQISFVPSAGAVAFDSENKTMIRYIERATGHIYETESDKSTITRLSNVTIPKIHDTLWTADGSKLILRYLKDDNSTIRTFYAKIATTTRPEQALEGLFLPDGIRQITLAGNKIFYLSETATGLQGILANIDGGSKTSVFTSSFADWNVSPATTNLVTLFSRPSGTDKGHAYSLNTTTGVYTKIIGDILGLVALQNTDGSRAIISRTIDQGLSTLAFDAKTGTTSVLGISTIADKCVWSSKQKTIVFCAVPSSAPEGIYPDDWYKGKASFDDSLWKIDVATGETDNLMSPELETGVSMDMTDLKLDQKESIVIFTNKKDMTVWRFTF